MNVINEAERLRRWRVRGRIVLAVVSVVGGAFIWNNYALISHWAVATAKTLMPFATASTARATAAKSGESGEVGDVVSALEARVGLTRQGIPRGEGGSGGRYAYRDVQCLARVVYHDGREHGPVARSVMARVALNRLETEDFGSSICEVVYRGMGRQFGCMFRESCREVGSVPNDLQRWQQALATSIGVLKGEVDTSAVGNATHFHKKGTKPRWLTRVTTGAVVDGLVLSVEKRGAGSGGTTAGSAGRASGIGQQPRRAGGGTPAASGRSSLGGPVPRSTPRQSRVR